MPDRGEVWLAALDPVGPGEQGGTRPVLVVSTNAFNVKSVAQRRLQGFNDHHQAVAPDSVA